MNYTPQSAIAMGVCLGLLLAVFAYGVYRLSRFFLEDYREKVVREVEREFESKSQNKMTAEPRAQTEYEQSYGLSQDKQVYWYGARQRYCPNGYIQTMNCESGNFNYFVCYEQPLSLEQQEVYKLSLVAITN